MDERIDKYIDYDIEKCGHPGVRELKDVTYSIMECNFTYGDIEDLMYGGRSKVCPLVKQFLHPDVVCLLYTSPSPRDGLLSRMPSSA